MEEELRRIRAKDYTELDQRLFDNMTKADNLSSALYQLSDFQKFLMDQIATLSKEEQTSRISHINTSIVQNIDELKHSILKCSTARPKVSVALKRQVNQLKVQLQSVKKDMKGEIRRAVEKTTGWVLGSFKEVVGLLERERKAHTELRSRYAALQHQKEELAKENQTIRGLLTNREEHCPTPITHSPPVQTASLSLNSAVPVLSNYPQITTHSYQTPLKGVSQNSPATLPFHSVHHIKQQDWKIIRQKISLGCQGERESHQPKDISRGNSLNRHTSNHELSRKPQLHCPMDKQNETIALRSKGVDVRGRSKQKIKLCSMF